MRSFKELKLTEDPQWELALLATVQSFYQRLLSTQLGGELPVPAQLAPQVITHSSDVRATLDQMQLWIQVLDMAITPAMLRLGVQSDLDPEVAEALLRYFARHRDDSGANRDKTDLVATFLFRHPRVAGQWERRGYGLDGSIPLSPFEIALLEILSESDVPVLSESDVHLLREFGPLLEQANRFQDFNSLMDSGIITRVRELKAALGQSIYHPGVLATLASYNSAFGDRFNTLFGAAAHEIKDFAKHLEEALRYDRAPSKVLQFNDFGLVAITRKRVKQSLERTIGSPCPYCQATGFVKSVSTICNEVYVEMRKISNHLEHSDVMLRVNPEVAKALKTNNAKLLNEMEELTKKTIIVKSDPALHQEQFDIH